MIAYHRRVPSIWFRISFAEKAFLRFLTERDLAVENLSVEVAVDAMAAFVAGRRAQHTDLDEDGDGLLVEWGAHEQGWFLDLVRQMVRSGDDQPIRQLRLRLVLAGDGPAPGSAWFFDGFGTDDLSGRVRLLEGYPPATRADIVQRELVVDTL